MRKLVIYYSHDGNTRFVAETLSDIMGADIMELKPEKIINTTGIMKVTWGVRQLFTQPKPKLLKNDVKPSDIIILLP